MSQSLGTNIFLDPFTMPSNQSAGPTVPVWATRENRGGLYHSVSNKQQQSEVELKPAEKMSPLNQTFVLLNPSQTKVMSSREALQIEAYRQQKTRRSEEDGLDGLIDHFPLPTSPLSVQRYCRRRKHSLQHHDLSSTLHVAKAWFLQTRVVRSKDNLLKRPP